MFLFLPISSSNIEAMAFVAMMRMEMRKEGTRRRQRRERARVRLGENKDRTAFKTPSKTSGVEREQILLKRREA